MPERPGAGQGSGHRTWVPRADVEGEMLDVIVEPVGRPKAPAPHDRLGTVGSGECPVSEPDDARLGRLSAEEGHPPVVTIPDLLRPLQGGADEVGAAGEVENVMPARVVVDGALDRGSVVGHAVPLGGIRGASDVNHRVAVGERAGERCQGQKRY